MDGALLNGLEPRKTPRQARSEATVDAIFEATVQVLLAEGAQRLTTTRVAARAGVSVGTMYQYFPHKQALLYAVLRRHLDTVAQAVEAACARSHGHPVATVAGSLVAAYVDAKTANLEASRALYLVSAEFDVSGLVNDASKRILEATATALDRSPDAEFDDLPAVAFAVTAALAGAVRVAFERSPTPFTLWSLRAELVTMCQAYLQAAALRPKRLVTDAPSGLRLTSNSAR